MNLLSQMLPKPPVCEIENSSSAFCNNTSRAIKRFSESGSGTADQSVYFCQKLSNVIWQTSDRSCYHELIHQTLEKEDLPKNRIKAPVAFDIEQDSIAEYYDVFYASNIVHCIPWSTTELLFKKISTALKADGLFILYGPYNIKTDDNPEGFTSEGNKNFDAKLKRQDLSLGLRDMKDIKDLAESNGLCFFARHDHTAANNYILIFKKTFSLNQEAN